jgi:hypothetical protein
VGDAEQQAAKTFLAKLGECGLDKHGESRALFFLRGSASGRGGGRGEGYSDVRGGWSSRQPWTLQ